MADRPLRSPISLYFARFSPKCKKKPLLSCRQKRFLFWWTGMDSSACGRPGAALTVHRTVIHSRPSNPFLSNAKKEDELCSSSFFGGRGWIRTIVVCDNGFTVRSLWPLGNPSESTYLLYTKFRACQPFRNIFYYYCIFRPVCYNHL